MRKSQKLTGSAINSEAVTTPLSEIAQSSHSQYDTTVSHEILGGLLSTSNAGDGPSLSPGYLAKLAALFPSGKFEHFFRAWHKALQNCDSSPESFQYARFQCEVGYFASNTFGAEQAYLVTTSSSTDSAQHAVANDTIALYVPKKNLSEYAFELDEHSPFAFCLAQAIDAETHPDVGSNALVLIGKYAWFVNKRPGCIGETVIAPIDSGFVETPTQGAERLEGTTEAHAYGTMISSEFLAVVLYLCDTYNQTAERIHIPTNKTVPWHDHFIACPEDSPAILLLHNLLRTDLRDKDGVHLYFPESTPFDTLAITGKDRSRLIEKTTAIVQALEQAREVFSVVYHKGTIFITPYMRGSSIDTFTEQPLRSSIADHGMQRTSANSMLLPALEHFVAMRGAFDWRAYISIPEERPTEGSFRIASSGRETKLRFFTRNVQYGLEKTWGSGALLDEYAPDLPPRVRALYEQTRKLQDFRLDPGHGELVTYFAHMLAKERAAPTADIEIATCAAVLHDVGYSQIENVHERFARVTQLRQSEKANERAWAQKEDHALRIMHQKLAVDLAETFLTDYSQIEAVKNIIGDHDTRVHQPRSLPEALLRDADMVTRLTWRTAVATVAQKPEVVLDIPMFIRSIEANIAKTQKTGFYLPEALAIAKLEMAATALRLVDGDRALLPPRFKRVYGEELSRVII